VGDLVEALVGLVDCKAAAGKVFNIGSNEEISIEGLAEKIIGMTGSKSRKEYISYEDAYGRPIDDMMRRVPNIGRIQGAIGWQPKTNLTETLEKIIESLRGAAKR
jgi:UDP-glucose 4-epimerase